MDLSLQKLQQQEREVLHKWSNALAKVPTDVHYVDYAIERLGFMLGELHFPRCPELFTTSMQEKGRELNKTILPMCAGDLAGNINMAPFLRMLIAALNADQAEIAMYRHMHDNGVKLLGIPYAGLYNNSTNVRTLHFGQRIVGYGYLPGVVEYVGTIKNAPDTIRDGLGEAKPDPLTPLGLIKFDDTYQLLHNAYFPRKIIVGELTPVGLVEPIS